MPVTRSLSHKEVDAAQTLLRFRMGHSPVKQHTMSLRERKITSRHERQRPERQRHERQRPERKCAVYKPGMYMEVDEV